MRTNRLILFLGATLLLAACGKEAPSPDAGSLPDHCIELRLANLHPALETKAGNQRKILHPGEAPHAVFYIAEDDEVIKAYEYCNLHGLWSAKP